MSSQNDNNSGAAMGFAVVCTVIAAIGLSMYALLAFIALIFTVLCLLAWNNTLTIGKETIEPHEARAFILRGLAGAVLVPVFAGFAAILFDGQVDPNFWGHRYSSR